MTYKTLSLSLGLLLLAGCSNSDISAVQQMTMGDDPTLTVEQAFDHRKVCQSVHWTTLTDDRGRTLVEYRCTFKGVDAYVNGVVAQEETAARKDTENQKQAYLDTIQTIRNALIQQKATLAGIKDTVPPTSRGGVNLQQIPQLQAQLAVLKGGNLQAMLATTACQPVDPNAALYGGGGNGLCYYANQYQTEMTYAQKMAATGNMTRATQSKAAAAQLASTLQSNLSGITDATAQRLQELQQLAQQAVALEGNSKKVLADNIADGQARLDRKLAGQADNFASLDNALKAQLAQLKPKNPMTKVDEVFQWVVPGKGQSPSLTYAGLEYTFTDGSKKTQRYLAPDVAVQLIIQNDISSFTRYKQSLGT